MILQHIARISGQTIGPGPPAASFNSLLKESIEIDEIPALKGFLENSQTR